MSEEVPTSSQVNDLVQWLLSLDSQTLASTNAVSILHLISLFIKIKTINVTILSVQCK